ncbi:MAG: BadF/BadG/BcrA/BcrD ATPase family protein [Desulfuromonadales bacterium]|nr:BadF/BadG/BcrA/BcrD ATPase family protein [Desulfuromonadales bacterium]
MCCRHRALSGNHGRLPPQDIARSIHLSVVERVSGMLERLGITGDLVFSGGVARNPFLVEQLEKRLGVPVRVPDAPAIVGALGAALHAEWERECRNAI